MIEFAPRDLEQWLAGDGLPWEKAHSYFRYLEIAKAKNADAVGGLTSIVLDADQAKAWQAEPGAYFYGWGIALRSFDTNFTIDMTHRDTVRSIPLGLGALDSWEIPIEFAPAACSPTESPRRASLEGRPLVGVRLDGNTITALVPQSPEEAAGLRKGDVLTSCDGKALVEGDGLVPSLEGKKPGSEVELAFARDGEIHIVKLKLADHSEVEAKNSPIGRPLPDLQGKDIHGKEITLSNYASKVLILDFWATWCGPCVRDMPLQQLLLEQLEERASSGSGGVLAERVGHRRGSRSAWTQKTVSGVTS